MEQKNLIQTLQALGDDIKYWVTNNISKLIEKLSKKIVAESDNWEISDAKGNTIFKVDEGGAHTTALTIIRDGNYETVVTREETEEIINDFGDKLVSSEDAWQIQDKDGNIIARIDGKGMQVTKLSAKELYIGDVMVNEEGLDLPKAEDNLF